MVLEEPGVTPIWAKAWFMAEANRPPFPETLETPLASLSPSLSEP
ncbi:hypothetical protein SFMTTN_0489 [Sulfuriferula multivorans]|uniref:Uncharacterized protein n=1 Tax=Sulfuriferula multivorans TaxID=1559896 RepID=A0A401JAK0_9PROT|nr:hypothetical protein SFMTTN_0489 [Sulfuriferula multivorans]